MSTRTKTCGEREIVAMLRWCLVCAIVVGAWNAPPARAQEPIAAPAQSQQTGATADAGVPEAPVVYLNRTITVFRAPLFGMSPERRAQRTAEVLDNVLARMATGTVTTRADPAGNFVLIDGEMAIILVEADADRIGGETLATATERAAGALQVVIAETRESRDRARLLANALRAFAGTLLLVALIASVRFVSRQLSRRLGRLAERAASATRVSGTQVITAERLLPIGQHLVTLVGWVLILVLVYRWLGLILTQFPYTRPWGEQLRAFFVTTGLQIGQGVLGALPDLAIAIFILFVAHTIIGLVSPFFDRVRAGHLSMGWLDSDTAQPTRQLFAIAVRLFALVMAYPYLPGSQSEAFRGMSVLLGLMVTFGGSSLFGQGASGFVLMYSRTFRIGEYVRVADHEGIITELGSFTTKVRTDYGEELTLPNALVLTTVVTNYSRMVDGPGYVVNTAVTIGYDTPWRQVEAMLVEAAHRTPGVLATPAPRVFQSALSDFYPEYRLVCQAIPPEPRPRAEVLAALHANIQDVFNEHGVQIMSPHYLGDPAGPKVVPKAKWFEAPARPPQA